MPSLSERFLSQESGRVENLFKKVIRHVLTGQFDPSTLKRGLEYLKKYKESRNIKRAQAKLSENIPNYFDREDLDVSIYKLVIQGKEVPEAIMLTEFPEHSRLRILTVDWNSTDNGPRGDNHILDLHPNFIAAFVGPTKREYLPNNGYYDATAGGLLEPFMDTNPYGQRRGALAIDKNGEFSILTEPEKLAARDKNFEDYNQVSGTSFYLTNEDSAKEDEFLQEPDRSELSYAISFHTKEGKKCLAYAKFSVLVTRYFVKTFLDQVSKERGWTDYIAAELELMGSFMTVKKNDQYKETIVAPRSNLMYRRRDHYIIEETPQDTES